MGKHTYLYSLSFLALVSLFATSLVAQDTLVWSPAEEEPDLNWSNASNWAADEVPALTPFIFSLGAMGSDLTGEVTTILDQDRSLAGLLQSPNGAAWGHHWDLDGHAITFNGAGSINMTPGASGGTTELKVSGGSWSGSLIALNLSSSSPGTTFFGSATLDLTELSSVDLSLGSLTLGTGTRTEASLLLGDNAAMIVSGNFGIRATESGVASMVFGNNGSLSVGSELSRSTIQIANTGTAQTTSFTMGTDSTLTLYGLTTSIGTTGSANTTVTVGDSSTTVLDTNVLSISTGAAATTTVNLGDNATVIARTGFSLGTGNGSKGFLTLGENSHFQIGTSDSPVTSHVQLGINSSSATITEGVINLGAGSTYAIYVSQLTMGFYSGSNTYNGQGFMNFQDTSSGVFQANGLIRVGMAARNSSGGIRLGTNASVQINSEEDRFDMILGRSNGGSGGTVHGEFTLLGGSHVEAWVNELVVGSYFGTSTGNRPDTSGILDWGGATGFLVANNITIGSGRFADATVSFGDMDVTTQGLFLSIELNSTAHGSLQSTLNLMGSRVSFENLTIDGSGAGSTVNINVLGKSAGFFLESDSTININNGVINVVFHDPTPFNGWYSAISWEGNHVSTLQDWVSNNLLVIDDTTFLSPEYAGLAEIIFLADANTTILGFQVIPEPATVALILAGLTLALTRRQRRSSS